MTVKPWQIPTIRGVAKTARRTLARVRIWDGSNAQQADLSAIVYSVFYADTGAVVSGHNGATVTIATSIFDALQTGSEWTKDTTGYNFAHTIDATAFPKHGIYRVEYLFTPTTGEPFRLAFNVDASRIYTG